MELAGGGEAVVDAEIGAGLTLFIAYIYMELLSVHFGGQPI